MKRIKIILTIMVAMLIYNMNVNAISGTMSVNKSSVEVGDSFVVSVNIEAASWNIHVTSSGPVGICSINEGDVSTDAKDTEKTFRTTCNATGEGTITLELTGDITSEDNETIDLSSIKTVTVTKKEDNPIDNNDDNNNNNNNNNDGNDNDTNNPVDNKDDKEKENIDNPKTGIVNYFLIAVALTSIAIIALKYNGKFNVFKKIK